jgi:hypothetical protein
MSHPYLIRRQAAAGCSQPTTFGGNHQAVRLADGRKAKLTFEDYGNSFSGQDRCFTSFMKIRGKWISNTTFIPIEVRGSTEYRWQYDMVAAVSLLGLADFR